MDRNMVFELSKKIIKIIVTVKFAGKCIKIGKAVYDSIPKYDTIENIDADILIEQNTTDLSEIDLSLPENLPEFA